MDFVSSLVLKLYNNFQAVHMSRFFGVEGGKLTTYEQRLPDHTSAPVKAGISQHQVSDTTAESLFCLATWSKILTPVKKEPLELRFWKKLIHLAWLYLNFLSEYDVTFLFKNLKTYLAVQGET